MHTTPEHVATVLATVLAGLRWPELSMAAVGVAESIALAGLGLTVFGFAGTTVASGVKALWAISKGLGTFEGKILEILARHEGTLDDHEERLRIGRL